MREDHTRGTKVEASPRGRTTYGLGAWREAVDSNGVADVLASPGGGGFVPRVHFARRLVVIFAAADRIERVTPIVTAVNRAALCATDATVSPSCGRR